ncbi:MAG: isoprenylcysteine carboxylmethyltransferase family protein, partial [Anaerolineales bacterium]|nr:isoprenylcysteine carboxylmethyltransferase family protein [Anaerolineales bacterium]
FIAWVAILAGVLFNLDGWFHDPFSWHQLISWPVLIISLYLLIHSLVLLKRSGRQDARRSDVPLLEFEKTTALVTDGIYRYIRHPMYSSLLFLAWGVFFKSPSWVDGLIVMVATLALVATARTEEAEDVRFFGETYQDYMRRSKRFIPFIF